MASGSGVLLLLTAFSGLPPNAAYLAVTVGGATLIRDVPSLLHHAGNSRIAFPLTHAAAASPAGATSHVVAVRLLNAEKEDLGIAEFRVPDRVDCEPPPIRVTVRLCGAELQFVLTPESAVDQRPEPSPTGARVHWGAPLEMSPQQQQWLLLDFQEVEATGIAASVDGEQFRFELLDAVNGTVIASSHAAAPEGGVCRWKCAERLKVPGTPGRKIEFRVVGGSPVGYAVFDVPAQVGTATVEAPLRLAAGGFGRPTAVLRVKTTMPPLSAVKPQLPVILRNPVANEMGLLSAKALAILATPQSLTEPIHVKNAAEFRLGGSLCDSCILSDSWAADAPEPPVLLVLPFPALENSVTSPCALANGVQGPLIMTLEKRRLNNGTWKAVHSSKFPFKSLLELMCGEGNGEARKTMNILNHKILLKCRLSTAQQAGAITLPASTASMPSDEQLEDLLKTRGRLVFETLQVEGVTDELCLLNPECVWLIVELTSREPGEKRCHFTLPCKGRDGHALLFDPDSKCLPWRGQAFLRFQMQRVDKQGPCTIVKSLWNLRSSVGKASAAPLRLNKLISTCDANNMTAPGRLVVTLTVTPPDAEAERRTTEPLALLSPADIDDEEDTAAKGRRKLKTSKSVGDLTPRKRAGKSPRKQKAQASTARAATDDANQQVLSALVSPRSSRLKQRPHTGDLAATTTSPSLKLTRFVDCSPRYSDDLSEFNFDHAKPLRKFGRLELLLGDLTGVENQGRTFILQLRVRSIDLQLSLSSCALAAPSQPASFDDEQLIVPLDDTIDSLQLDVLMHRSSGKEARSYATASLPLAAAAVCYPQRLRMRLQLTILDRNGTLVSCRHPPVLRLCLLFADPLDFPRAFNPPPDPSRMIDYSPSPRTVPRAQLGSPASRQVSSTLCSSPRVEVPQLKARTKELRFAPQPTDGAAPRREQQESNGRDQNGSSNSTTNVPEVISLNAIEDTTVQTEGSPPPRQSPLAPDAHEQYDGGQHDDVEDDEGEEEDDIAVVEYNEMPASLPVHHGSACAAPQSAHAAPNGQLTFGLPDDSPALLLSSSALHIPLTTTPDVIIDAALVAGSGGGPVDVLVSPEKTFDGSPVVEPRPNKLVRGAAPQPGRAAVFR